MIPESLHKAHFVLDLTNLGLGLLDQLWVLESLGVVLELVSLLDEFNDLTVDAREALERSLTASVITVEVALFHGSDVSLEVFLVTNDDGCVSLALAVDERSDLLLDVLAELLEGAPLVEEFLGLLDLLVLADVVLLKELERLVELVQVERGLVVLLEDNLHAVLDADEVLDHGEVLVLEGQA